MAGIEHRSCREAETLAVPHQIVAALIQSQGIGAEAGESLSVTNSSAIDFDAKSLLSGT